MTSTLAEKVAVGTVWRCTAIATYVHLRGAAGEHAPDTEAGPGCDAVVAKFIEITCSCRHRR